MPGGRQDVRRYHAALIIRRCRGRVDCGFENTAVDGPVFSSDERAATQRRGQNQPIFQIRSVCKNLHADAVSVVARTVADCDPFFRNYVEAESLFTRCADGTVCRYLGSVAVAVIGQIYLGRRWQSA